MPSYADRLKWHLASYKKIALGVAEDGAWSRNGRQYPHILPSGARDLNLLPPIRTAFWEYANQTGLSGQLHRDFCHLNSSQALAFNLFFPLVGLPRSQPDLLLDALGIVGPSIQSFCFEAVPDKKEGTNFDFVAALSDGARLLVELKLSETEFGRCKPDADHEAKRRALYVERLAGKVNNDAVQPSMFFANYQLLRNVSHLREQDTLVLLVPRANAGTFSQAQSFIITNVAPAWRARVRLAALEDVIDSVCANSPNEITLGVFELLREKYVIPSKA